MNIDAIKYRERQAIFGLSILKRSIKRTKKKIMQISAIC